MKLARLVLHKPNKRDNGFWLTLNAVAIHSRTGVTLVNAVVRRAKDPGGTLEVRPDPDDFARATARLEMWAQGNGWTIEDVPR